jgi:mono/diheme cytochrome c family protein
VIRFFAPAFAVAAACVFSASAFAQGAPKGDATNGKKLYETIGCFECHGFAGQGGAAGPKLIEPPPWEAFVVQVRTPRAVMPPYTTRVLSDQQAADIYAHLLTFPKPRDPATIPLLRN